MNILFIKLVMQMNFYVFVVPPYHMMGIIDLKIANERQLSLIYIGVFGLWLSLHR